MLFKNKYAEGDAGRPPIPKYLHPFLVYSTECRLRGMGSCGVYVGPHPRLAEAPGAQRGEVTCESQMAGQGQGWICILVHVLGDFAFASLKHFFWEAHLFLNTTVYCVLSVSSFTFA